MSAQGNPPAWCAEFGDRSRPEPVLIAAGLLAMARYERSRLLVVVAGVVATVLVAVPEGTMSTLIPAVIVLAAAFAALHTRSPVVARSA
ncbi:hypothetical protein [Actinophytocola glycyrrhizae]|uniref:Uncharacterized protein n=1 Tax=Actinophytocola glycyrrhizae TaxID=2044873 RepID=A0ABV9RW17_9PSEU